MIQIGDVVVLKGGDVVVFKGESPYGGTLGLVIDTANKIDESQSQALVQVRDTDKDTALISACVVSFTKNLDVIDHIEGMTRPLFSGDVVVIHDNVWWIRYGRTRMPK